MSDEMTTHVEGSYEAPGFWLRAGAYMIDSILVGVIAIVLQTLLRKMTPAIPIVQFFIGLLGAALNAAYFTWFVAASNGQTLGKRAAGIAVVRMDGSPIGFGRAFLRALSYYISTVIFFIGFIMAAFTDQKRALHDYFVDTRVVRVQEISKGQENLVVAIGLLFPALFVLGILAAILIPLLVHRPESLTSLPPMQGPH
jgi:uncharacterized RDD family membrane protein YckC